MTSEAKVSRIEAIKARRDWRAGKDLSPFEVRLDDECLAKHYAEDVTYLIKLIEDHDANRELGRCDGLLGQDLPSVADLVGSDPGLTGGLSAVEYQRERRGQ